MAWCMSIWILIATATAVAPSPLRIPTTKCIPQGSYCMNTDTPCCQSAELQSFHVRHNERICFIFGQGLCQPFDEIPQVQLYVELGRKLNSTNYMELRRAYRRELDTDPQAELVDSPLLRSPTSDNHATAIFINSPLTLSQIIPNDRAIKLTNSSAIPTQMVRNDTATKLTDPNVSSTHMVLNDAASPTISVQKSSKNITSEIKMFPFTPVQLIPLDTVREVGTKLTDPNVSSTHMVPNDAASPTISVQKSSKNITSEIKMFPFTPVQLIPLDTVREVGTKLTDPNVSSTHMVLNDAASPTISVQKSSKNKTSKINMSPFTPVQLIPLDTVREVGTVPSIPGQMLGEDISEKIPKSKKLPPIIPPKAWGQMYRTRL